jgi:hypothetical protein
MKHTHHYVVWVNHLGGKNEVESMSVITSLHRRVGAALAAVTLLGCVSFAQASIIPLTTNDADPTNYVLLSDLVANGDSIQVGDKLFDQWFVDLTQNVTSSATPPTAADIKVFGSTNVSGDYGLKFLLVGFNVGPTQALNANLEFRVTVTNPNFLISDIEMGLTGGGAAGTGVASITEVVQTAKNGSIVDNLFVGQTQSFSQLQQHHDLAQPLSSIFVTKDVGVAGHSAGIAHISAFTQYFSQVNNDIPEPASLALFAIGGMMLVHRRRKA